MNACVLVHCFFACQINLNVWAHMVLHVFVLHVKNRSLIVLPGLQALSLALPLPLSFPAVSILWYCRGACFNRILNRAYALPAMFSLRLLGDRMPTWEKLLCHIIIPLSLVLPG